MDNEQAAHSYKHAGQLHKEGKYAEALAILDNLSREFPDAKNVIFARVRCMAALDRLNDALQGCNYLIQKFQHQGAQQLKVELEAKLAAPAMPEIPDIDLDMGPSAFSAMQAPAAARQASSMSGMKLATIIGGALVLLLIVGTILMAVFTDYGEGDPASGQSSSDYERKLAQMQNMENMSEEEIEAFFSDEDFLRELGSRGIGLMVMIGIFVLLTFPSPLYLTLMITGKLPNDEFFSDYLKAALITFISLPASCFCFAGLFIVAKTYDLSFVDILILIGLDCAYIFITFFIISGLSAVAF